MTMLSVNLNKFALLRNSRDKDSPNLIDMAKRCVKSGAHGITVHPRPDQRHSKYKDVRDLSVLIDDNPMFELNVEGNPSDSFLELVKQAQPTQCTLVPDLPEQLTSDHGWDLNKNGELLAPIIQDLRKAGIRVSLFLDPDVSEVNLARSIGTDRIELYTQAYADAFGKTNQEEVLQEYRTAVFHAQRIGLGVNAGHDLNLRNLKLFLTIPGILEVSIGHAIVVDCLDYGLEGTLSRYLKIVQEV